MPRFAATKTLEDALARRHRERARLLVVERTQPDKVCTTPLQRHVIAYHLLNLGGGKHTFYGLARYQGMYDL